MVTESGYSHATATIGPAAYWCTLAPQRSGPRTGSYLIHVNPATKVLESCQARPICKWGSRMKCPRCDGTGWVC